MVNGYNGKREHSIQQKFLCRFERETILTEKYFHLCNGNSFPKGTTLAGKNSVFFKSSPYEKESYSMLEWSLLEVYPFTLRL